MNKSIDYKLILQKIKELEDLSSKSRNVVKTDINHINKNINNNITKKIKKINIKEYKIQEEYGEKKFIKPWRTGTKSQQQPPKAGKKSGGRGKQRG